MTGRGLLHCEIAEKHGEGGMGFGKTAEALGISLGTVKRDWAVARARLRSELSQRTAQ